MATKKNMQGGAITKKEGVRRALAELGSTALPGTIQAFVKEHFGIVMTKDHVSVCKGEIRREAAKPKTAAEKTAAPEPAAPAATERSNGKTEALPQPVPAAETAGAVPAARITKMDAVRSAVKELKSKATPLNIQAFVKERFGLEMDRDMISTYKSDILKKLSAKKKGAKPVVKKEAARKEPMPAPAVQPVLALPTPAAVRGMESVQLEDVLLLKKLLERVGVEQFRTLLGVLAK